ncbi:alpha/beta hydrolase [Gaetbulibacter jejuensis]|uniref:alpha/beta hydrolase n=1 Tax=Gaetbulibacter jejuensis TaxID=584607 RepID=UPI00300975E2
MKQLLAKFLGFSLNMLSYISKSFAANRALALFSMPLKGKATEEQTEFLETSFREELMYDNIPIMTYRWVGKNKTILLLHGWESNSARWKNLILNLKKKDYNIIAIDAPAHGKSGGTSFNAMLYSEFINVAVLKFKPEIIIGHSVGGMASIFFQYKYQIPFIKKFILLGAPSEFKDILGRYTKMMGYNQRINTKINSIILERFGVKPEEFSSSEYIKQNNSEGLIIHDEQDQIIPYKDALLIKSSFKNSKLITTQGMGHSLNNDTVTSYINDFIDA